LIAWKLTVSKAIRIITAAVVANTHQPIWMKIAETAGALLLY
jgi:hypothetical protein